MPKSHRIDELKQEMKEAIASLNYPLLEKLVDELDSLGSMEADAWSLIGKGVIEMVKNNDYVKSLECFELAKTKCNDLNDRQGLAKAVSNIGVVHLQNGNYISALEHLREGKELFQETGDRMGVASTILNSAMVRNVLKDRGRALKELQQAKTIFEELDQKVAICRVLTTMGWVNFEEGDIDKAVECHQNAYEIAKQITGNNSSLLDAGCSLVRCFIQQGKLEDAHSMYSSLEKIDSYEKGSIMQKKVCEGALHMANNELDLAYASMNEALQVSQDVNNVKGQMMVRAEMLVLAQKMGDFEGYIKHNETIKKLKEETEGYEKQRLIAIQEKEREMQAERREHERERTVLYSTLPKNVADRVVRGEQVTDHFDNASVLFLDIAGFTKLSAKIPAGHVVHLLEAIFSSCDRVCEKNNITKVKTIGDSYMAAGGVSAEDGDHVNHIAKTAVEILEALNSLEINMPEELGDKSWIENVDEINVRIGLHCGPLVAGVVGKERLQYDVWGDTVNMASRMESTGEPGKIQVSEEFANALQGDWKLEERQVEVKGKGMVRSFFLGLR